MINRRKAVTRLGSRVLGLLLLTGAVAGPAAGAEISGSLLRNLVARSWQLKDGLPQNNVPAIVQTRDGFLWVGTQEGLARFDGVEFRVFGPRNVEVFRDSRVFALAEDRDGVLWVGTGAGLVRYEGGTFSALSTEDDLSGDRIRALCEDPQGGMWVGSRNGLDLVSAAGVTSFADRIAHADCFVTAVVADYQSGAVWVGTNGGGLLRRDGDGFEQFTDVDGLPSNQINALSVDDSGRLWVATYSGLGVMDRDGFTTFTVDDGLTSNQLEAVFSDTDGATVWIGTTNAGLNRYSHGQFASFGEHEGLSTNGVESILRDREGNLWVGTASGGLNRLQDYGLALFCERDGLSSNIVSGVLEDHAGRIWAGTFEHGLNVLENGRFRTFRAVDGLLDDAVNALWEDRDHALWIGTRTAGLIRFADGVFTAHPEVRGTEVRAVSEDREGALWVGTYGEGVIVLRSDGVSALTTGDGLSSDYVITLYLGSDGSMWIGTDGGGVSRVPPTGEVISYREESGLSSPYIMSIFEDRNGTLWVGTSLDGLCRFENQAFTCYGVRDGLWSNRVFEIFDHEGDLWMTCNRGVFRTSKADLAAFDRGELEKIPCAVYGREPGVGDLECNGGYKPAGWHGSDGRFWFGTIEGLAALDPSRVELKQMAPPVYIEELVVDRESRSVEEHVTLSPGVQRVSFRYVGLAYTSPGSVTYSYRLEGVEDDWVEAGSRREVNYTHLSPGDYRFEVQACNSEGMCSVTPARLMLTVGAPFWRKGWFLAAMSLTLFACVYSVGRWRQAVRHRRDQERVELVRSLTVGVLHELRQPLQVIQSQIEILELDPATLKTGVQALSAQLARLRNLLAELDELQHQPTLRTTPYARDDTMIDLSRKGEDD